MDAASPLANVAAAPFRARNADTAATPPREVAPPPLFAAGMSIPHVRQRFTWDCGVACLAAALLAIADDDKRPRDERRERCGAGEGSLAAVGSGEPAGGSRPTEPRRSARLSGALPLPQPLILTPSSYRNHDALLAALCASLAGESVWTIDLAHLAARLGLRAELWTTAPGFTSAYASEPFYAPEAGVDRSRVESLFGSAEEAGVVVHEKESSLGDVLRLLEGGRGGSSSTIAIVLLDRNVLEQLLRLPNAGAGGQAVVGCRGKGPEGGERQPTETCHQKEIETGLLFGTVDSAAIGENAELDRSGRTTFRTDFSSTALPALPYAGHYVILVSPIWDAPARSRGASPSQGADGENPPAPSLPPHLVLRDPAWPHCDRVVPTPAFEQARKAYGTDQDILFLTP